MAGTVSTTYPQKGIVRVIWSALSGSENGNAASIARWPRARALAAKAAAEIPYEELEAILDEAILEEVA